MGRAVRAKVIRQTQEERRRQTQAAILAASIGLLTEKGYAGFSASRVAARAGVSRGAQEHYFPKKVDLIAAATQHAMNEAVAHAQALAARATRSADPVAQFLMDSQHFFFNPLYRAMVESMIAARSDRALARVCYPIVRQARITLNKIWIDTLRQAGYSRQNAQKFVELTHYLVRGIFLVDTWLPYDIDRAEALDAWHRLAPAALRLGDLTLARSVGSVSRGPRKIAGKRTRMRSVSPKVLPGKKPGVFLVS
jgi:AcrR family transcriptional regulator